MEITQVMYSKLAVAQYIYYFNQLHGTNLSYTAINKEGITFITIKVENCTTPLLFEFAYELGKWQKVIEKKGTLMLPLKRFPMPPEQLELTKETIIHPIDEKEILSTINKIETLHINDPHIYDYWEELTTLLTKDETATINYLNNCQNPDIIDHISAVFEDISIVFQSNRFIQCLESLPEKFPHLHLHAMILAAKNVFSSDE